MSAAYFSRKPTISSRGANPSGWSPAYGAPGRSSVQFGVTSRKLSQRRRHVSAHRSRSSTSGSMPRAHSSCLTANPACPPPITTRDTPTDPSPPPIPASVSPNRSDREGWVSDLALDVTGQQRQIGRAEPVTRVQVVPERVRQRLGADLIQPFNVGP